MSRIQSTAFATTIATAAAVLLGPESTAHARSRYGGVWHEGTGTGAFVPFEAGFTLAGLQQYTAEWEDLRITDFELEDASCPPQEADLTASQWEEGHWNDLLTQYADLQSFELGLAQMCTQGWVLHDFEPLGWSCSTEGEGIVALFRDGSCDPELAPYVERADIWSFDQDVGDANAAGYMVTDFEVVQTPLGDEIVSVFYGGADLQQFSTTDRPGFEAAMRELDGTHVLEDMESFRASETRYVSGLWTLDARADDHEVGEVRALFSELVYLDEPFRQLVDLEAYPDVEDRRFKTTFDKYLDPAQAHGFVVLQAGDLVADDGVGKAIRPPAGTSGGVWMTPATVGVSASVTKLVTALAVMRYADQSLHPDWLSTPMVEVLPEEFEDFGPGVADITLRDLLTHRTGLSTFSVEDGVDHLATPGLWRAALVQWLQQPAYVTSGPTPFDYMNVHSELLALLMDEVVLPKAGFAGDEAWTDWVNAQVFQPAGIGARNCYWQMGHAISYTYEDDTDAVSYKFGVDPVDACAGKGSGAATFWLSPLDMAKLIDASRPGGILSPSLSEEMFAIGSGLDQFHLASPHDPYEPSSDNNPGTNGEEFHWKRGDIGLCFEGGRVASEALALRYDDFNADDSLCSSCPGCCPEEYRYELGYTGFAVGAAIHSAAISRHVPCGVVAQRLFPQPHDMMREAFLLPEDW